MTSLRLFLTYKLICSFPAIGYYVKKTEKYNNTTKYLYAWRIWAWSKRTTMIAGGVRTERACIRDHGGEGSQQIGTCVLKSAQNSRLPLISVSTGFHTYPWSRLEPRAPINGRVSRGTSRGTRIFRWKLETPENRRRMSTNGGAAAGRRAGGRGAMDGKERLGAFFQYFPPTLAFT